MVDSGDVQVEITNEDENSEEAPQGPKPESLGNSVSEVMRFFSFSVITVFVILNQLDISETYAIERGISNDILSADTFSKISNATDIIEWIQDYFVPKVLELDFYPYDQELYNSTQGRVAWFNILASNIRMVQKRMELKENESSRNKDQVDYMWEELDYDIFQSDSQGEMTSAYGPTKLFTFNDEIGVDNSGGYIQTVNATVIEANLKVFNKALTFLTSNNWIDRQTIALYIDFSTYNGHIGMLSYIRITIKISASGSVEKDLTTTSMNVEPYDSLTDIVRAVLELVFVFMSILYAAIEIYKIKLEVAAKKTEFMQEGGGSLNTGMFKMIWEGIKVHFSYFWNWMDFASILLCFVIIGLWIQYISSDLVSSGANSSTILDELGDTKLIYERYISACSINFLFIFVRILKYLNRFERIALLSNTFESAKDDIFYFFVLLITVLMAFVIFGHVAFGSTHYMFSSMGLSILACFFLLFGDLTVWFEIRKTHPIEATFFFFLFTFLIIFILINMFIAIINNNYSDNVEKLNKFKRALPKDTPHPIVAVWNKLKLMVRGIFDYCNKDRRVAKKFEGAEKSLMTAKDDVQVRFSEYNLNYKDSMQQKEFIDTEVLTDKEVLGKLAEITSMKKAEVKAAILFIVFAIVYAATLIEQCKIGTKYMLGNTMRTAIEDIKYEYLDDHYNVNNIYNYETFFLWSKEFPTMFTKRITGEVFVNDNYLIGSNLTAAPGLLDQGPIRLTMRRVKMKENKSNHYSEFQEDVREGDISAFSLTGPEDTSSFIGGASGFKYKYNKDSSFMDLGGYVLYMSSDYHEFNEQLDILKGDLILNDTSCSIVYDFVLYNGNVNNVIFSAVIFDIDSGGKINTSLYIWPMELQMYSTSRQIARAVFELVYIALFIYHIVMAVIAIKADSDNYRIWQRRLYEVLTDEQKNKRAAILPEWLRKVFTIISVNMFIDLAAYICGILAIAAWITYLTHTADGPDLPVKDISYFDNVDSLARDLKFYFDISSLALLLLFFSLLKFMAMSKALSFLQNTISEALVDLYFFIIMLITLMFGFVFMSYLAFGTHAESFSEITKSLITCFEMLVGTFDYEEMSNANPGIAPLFFILYLLMFVFVLLNIFVAILERAYSIVKRETEEERDSPVKFIEILIEMCVRKLRTQRDLREYDNEEMVNIMPEEVFVKLDTGLDGELEPDSWALRFSEHILMEKAKRSQVKSRLDIFYKRRKVKEMEGKGFLIGSSARRAEKKSRLQLWNYMRVGYQSLRVQEKEILQETKALVKESSRSYSEHTEYTTKIEELVRQVEMAELLLIQANKKEQRLLEKEKGAEKKRGKA